MKFIKESVLFFAAVATILIFLNPVIFDNDESNTRNGQSIPENNLSVPTPLPSSGYLVPDINVIIFDENYQVSSNLSRQLHGLIKLKNPNLSISVSKCVDVFRELQSIIEFTPVATDKRLKACGRYIVFGKSELTFNRNIHFSNAVNATLSIAIILFSSDTGKVTRNMSYKGTAIGATNEIAKEKVVKKIISKIQILEINV